VIIHRISPIPRGAGPSRNRITVRQNRTVHVVASTRLGNRYDHQIFPCKRVRQHGAGVRVPDDFGITVDLCVGVEFASDGWVNMMGGSALRVRFLLEEGRNICPCGLECGVGVGVVFLCGLAYYAFWRESVLLADGEDGISAAWGWESGDTG